MYAISLKPYEVGLEDVLFTYLSKFFEWGSRPTTWLLVWICFTFVKLMLHCSKSVWLFRYNSISTFPFFIFLFPTTNNTTTPPQPDHPMHSPPLLWKYSLLRWIVTSNKLKRFCLISLQISFNWFNVYNDLWFYGY